MRYVPSLPPPTLTGLGTREVRGVMRTRPIRPTRVRSNPEAGVDYGPAHEPHAEEVVPVPAVEHRVVHPEERRVACRRVARQPVLLDLRSRFDRRHHKLRGTDPTEHIDEAV